MAEYLDKEAFKKSVEERYCKPCKTDGKDHNGCWCRACWVDDMLDEVDCFQSSDVAPVVRCENCMDGMESDDNKYIICCRLGVGMNFDDFCSYSERKNEGDGYAAD